MKARIPVLGAAAALLSIATFSAPASAQYYRSFHNDNNYGRTTIRCDGDRCATWGCDRNGYHCRRISNWYSRSSAYQRNRYGRNDRDRDDRYDRDRDRNDRYDRDRDRDRDGDYDRDNP
jgi:hypothetical protein